MFSVVMIHVTTRILEAANYDLVHQSLTLFFNQATRFAVPIFFLISSFLLELNYPLKFDYLTYFKKRFLRLFIPYLFWSLIYHFFVYTIHNQNFFLDLLSGNASYQLYFIPTLLLFYLIFPYLHQHYAFFIKKSTLIILTISQLILLSIDYYYHPLPLPYPLSVFVLNFEFFLLGLIVYRQKDLILSFVKKFRYLFLSLSLLLAFFVTWEGRNLYLKTNNYLSFYSQWRPSVFFYSLSISAFLFYFFQRVKTNLSLIKILARNSFFVFFVHIIVLELSWKFIPHSLLNFAPFYFLIVATISYLLAIIVSKIPILNRLTN